MLDSFVLDTQPWCHGAMIGAAVIPGHSASGFIETTRSVSSAGIAEDCRRRSIQNDFVDMLRQLALRLVVIAY